MPFKGLKNHSSGERVNNSGRIRNRIRNFLKVGFGSGTLWKVGAGYVTKRFGSTTLQCVIGI
jgi:hypothetical protein